MMGSMKFATDRLLADLEAAARKLLELAKAVEPVQHGRIYIEKIKWLSLRGENARRCARDRQTPR
jgi:hypothetical protein